MANNEDIKFIITCRQLEWNEYFNDDLKKLDSTLKVYQIQDLTKEDISYLLKHKKINEDEFWCFITKNYLQDLLKNILIVKNTIHNYENTKNETISFIDVYKNIVNDSLSIKGKDRQASSNYDLTKLFNISSSLATYMLLNQEASISTDNLSKLADELFKVNSEIITKQDLDAILSTSLFKKDRDTVRFFHKSVQEFLVTRFVNDKRLNIKVIKQLFAHKLKFYERFEEVVVYLSSLDNRLFNKFIKFDPFIFKRHTGLGQKQQKKLLLSMLDKLKNKKYQISNRWGDLIDSTLVKFDKLPDLVSLIKKNIDLGDTDYTIFEYLVSILDKTTLKKWKA